jgi:beta-lactamase class D
MTKGARLVPLLMALLAIVPTGTAADRWQERPGWARFFQQAGVGGTIVVVDQRAGGNARLVHDTARAGTRFIPASTFKIAHALFALDAGIVRDEFQVFRWDGVQRERRYLREIGYGNADPSGGIDTFWLGGNLRISAEEQVAFLQRLYRNELPFRVEHQRLVKDVMIVEAGRNWILRAKTGWQARVQPQVGWWVGWVEWPEGPVFFAINIDMPKGAEDLAKREGIAREVLKLIGALPES